MGAGAAVDPISHKADYEITQGSLGDVSTTTASMTAAQPIPTAPTPASVKRGKIKVVIKTASGEEIVVDDAQNKRIVYRKANGEKVVIEGGVKVSPGSGKDGKDGSKGGTKSAGAGTPGKSASGGSVSTSAPFGTA